MIETIHLHKYSPRFRSVLEGHGIEILLTADLAPNMNAALAVIVDNEEDKWFYVEAG
jgi:hypothetical protein